MIETIPIEGSSDVMAPHESPKTLIRGTRVYARIIYSKLEGDTLLPVRKGLVGEIVPMIFTKAQLVAHDARYAALLPDGGRIAYAGDISEVLDQAGKREAAALLRMEFKRLNGEEGWAYTFYGFEIEDYELLKGN